jgi:hypothetical protein
MFGAHASEFRSGERKVVVGESTTSCFAWRARFSSLGGCCSLPTRVKTAWSVHDQGKRSCILKSIVDTFLTRRRFVQHINLACVRHGRLLTWPRQLPLCRISTAMDASMRACLLAVSTRICKRPVPRDAKVCDSSEKAAEPPVFAVQPPPARFTPVRVLSRVDLDR